VKLYEAMFLVDSSWAASDWQGVQARIRQILERAGAEIASLKKWDERKLAYKIKGQTRGTYLLCFFRVDGQKIQQIERDVKLSERILRVLILSAEGREQDIDKDTPATLAEKKRQDAKQAAAQPAPTEEAVSQQTAAEPGPAEELAAEQRPAPDTEPQAPEPAGEPAEQGQEEQRPAAEQQIAPGTEAKTDGQPGPQPRDREMDSEQAETQEQTQDEKVAE